MKDKKPKRSRTMSSIWLVTIFASVVTAILVILYVRFLWQTEEHSESRSYSAYYAMISDNRGSSLWTSLYEGAARLGQDQDIYVEMLGDHLTQEYSACELMEIAIASGVDGIIVEADESSQMRDLINQAVGEGIPVVTLYSDSQQSARVSYVGISNFDLGKEYGRQILKVIGEKKYKKDQVMVDVLINSHANTADQNILYMGLQEMVEQHNSLQSPATSQPVIDTELIAIDDTNAFSVEESVRDLFISKRDRLPDIIVCLNEIGTTSVYQAVVDYNRVGEVTILGYYASEAILNAIDRDVIYSTVSIDTEQMSRFCIEALKEYSDLGYTSQYFTGDVTLIDKSNISDYINPVKN